jgi:hypothetical protein
MCSAVVRASLARWRQCSAVMVFEGMMDLPSVPDWFVGHRIGSPHGTSIKWLLVMIDL